MIHKRIFLVPAYSAFLGYGTARNGFVRQLNQIDHTQEIDESFFFYVGDPYIFLDDGLAFSYALVALQALFFLSIQSLYRLLT